MFEDLIKKEPVEKAALPKCSHIYYPEKCEYYIPSSQAPVCEFFGKLSKNCYLDKFDI